MRPLKYTKRINVRIEESIYDKLKELAISNNTTMCDLIRDMINKKVKK